MGRSSRMDRWLAGRGRLVLVGIAILAILALPAANVFATHIFTDVSDSSKYAPAIYAIANAGITSGCSTTGPKFCPTGLVTRQQMAVFLNRLGNLNNELGPVTDALTVVGQTTVYGPETFTLAGSASTECFPSENAVPLASELPYLVTAQLTDAPVPSSTINVSVDDPDREDEVFEVCFTGIGGDTTAGAHHVVESLSLDLGSGLFASASAASRSNVLDIVKAWKN